MATQRLQIAEVIDYGPYEALGPRYRITGYDQRCPNGQFSFRVNSLTRYDVTDAIWLIVSKSEPPASMGAS